MGRIISFVAHVIRMSDYSERKGETFDDFCNHKTCQACNLDRAHVLALRDKPAQEKAAWRVLFDYYVFGDGQKVIEHLPVECHGPLAQMDELSARRLRAMLLNNLNR